ncbi:CRISPR-associated helicase/endonuclease Cas3 [Amphibacillus jilinensis]|uniref:CRISPR-associated helicase/endonuclease Cas3 n=1 Tax=Amphibacillus jilinensis TaxID=1216008 RepID=UPI00031CA3C6|nr:CRISPR-associated helicase/endonuclease Cas3 [Amphibacillus jilinensis]
MYIAHIRSFDGEIQTVRQHLTETCQLAEAIGKKINVQYLAGLAGLLHDMGKYTTEFKEYILAAVQNPDNPPKRGTVDHSTAGGRLLFEHYYGKYNTVEDIMVEVVGNAILSHHGYLQDYITPDLELKFLHRIKEKELKGYNEAKVNFFREVLTIEDFQSYVVKAIEDLKNFISRINVGELNSSIMFLTKYIFSALIDADRTSTRQFEENTQPQEIQLHHLLKDYHEKLLQKIESFKRPGQETSTINRLRHEMSLQCEQIAEKPSNIYSLSIPTGGGKTLASLRYALKHAILHHKKRVIYIVPFTTIIEQNAEEVRRILNDPSNILEHHSNVYPDQLSAERAEAEDGVMNVSQKLLLAKDNLDAPIIFTTMVQFLNVFYATGTRNIRRLHNLSESVIIFDEVQKVPIKCISLFNQAVNFLKNHCHSSIVLCTATQPALRNVEHNLQIGESAEMIGNIDQVIDEFSRVEIINQASVRMSTNDLAEFIIDQTNQFSSQLIILNTKSVVKELYRKLKETISEDGVFHLSTSMCAMHRKDILQKIKDKLMKKESIICVSTQLIEAGVDVSFQSVIRSLSGLDSIAQAAGRCNRHGEFKKGTVYLIDHEEESLKWLPEINIGKKITNKMLVDLSENPNSHGGDLLSRQALEYFFKNFYKEMAYDLDYPIKALAVKMTDLLINDRSKSDWYSAYSSKNSEKFPMFSHGSFQTAARHFSVIANQTTSILVPYGDGKEVIADINGNEKIEDWSLLFRQAQHYSVNVYDQEFSRLKDAGAIIVYFDGQLFSLDESYYSREYGIDLEGEAERSEFIF